jgi:hypothetical protein
LEKKVAEASAIEVLLAIEEIKKLKAQYFRFMDTKVGAGSSCREAGSDSQEPLKG